MKQLRSLLCLAVLAPIALAAQSITVTSPARADRWCRGQAYTISWTSTGAVSSTVNIRLWRGSESLRDITASTANNGSFSWTLPADLADGTYTVRVRSVDRGVVGESRPFAIVSCGGATSPPPPPPSGAPGSIAVLTPAAGAMIAASSDCVIAWKSKGTAGQPLNIRLFTSEKVLDRMIAVAIADNGSYSWPVPAGIMPGEYILKLETANGLIAGYSGVFSIRQPGTLVTLGPLPLNDFSNRGPLGLSISNPGHCDILKLGTSYSISWRATCPSDARLRILLVRGNRVVMTIAENVPACSRSFMWTVGQAANGMSHNLVGIDYRIVIQTPDGSDMAVNIRPFPIVDWTLTVQSPAGGETWPYGSQQTITWRTSGSAMPASPAYPQLRTVRINLIRSAGGATSTIALNAPDTGTFHWRVGDVVDNTGIRMPLADGAYTIQIYWGCGQGNICAMTRMPFTISNCPR